MVRAPQDPPVLVLVFAFAVAFRGALLFSSPPTLSDDVYRYMWDGHLLTSGINPYAFRVDAIQLDSLSTPYRELVNHSWMASPYLPIAQVYFASVAAIAPGSALAFQIAASLLDLVTGLVIVDLLRRLGFPPAYVLIYLWNPLGVVESAHGAHLDSLMVFLMMLALWALVARRSSLGSGLALAAATLTKLLPAFLVPVIVRRWGWKGALAYVAAVVVICLPFVTGAGHGLGPQMDGVGLFGAIRIYASQWEFNSSLHHWVEIVLSRGLAPWAAPVWSSRAVMSGLMAAVLAGIWLAARRQSDEISLLRLALVPLGAYLLLTTTVHPWYATLILPLAPYLLTHPDRFAKSSRFIVPCLAFAALVPVSYLAYLDRMNPRDYEAVRLVQYIPLFLLLAWSAGSTVGRADSAG